MVLFEGTHPMRLRTQNMCHVSSLGETCQSRDNCIDFGRQPGNLMPEGAASKLAEDSHSLFSEAACLEIDHSNFSFFRRFSFPTNLAPLPLVGGSFLEEA